LPGATALKRVPAAQIRSLPTPQAGSLFAIVVIQRFAAEDAAFGGANAPLLAVRIIDRFADGIVRDDVEDEGVL